MRPPSSRAPSFALAGLVVAAVALLALAGRGIPTPWILIDEVLHSELARGLRQGDGFSVRGHGLTVSYLYPALLAPFAWSYGAMKLVNAVVIALGAVPVYIWGRRLVRPWAAVVAAGLTLLLPSLLFSGELMLENLFYPLFLASCLAIALALERPTETRQALAVGMIVLATLTRVQGLLLFAVLVLSALAVRRDALRRLAPSLAIAAATGIVVVVRLALGNLGVYEVQARAGYSATGVLTWASRSLGELALSVGIVPVAALLALVLRHQGLRDRIFVAVTASATAVLVALAAAAASWDPPGLKERYMFYVAPLLLLALVVWIERGARHPWWAVAIPAALVVTLPLGRLFREPSLLGNAWALLPFERAGLTTSRVLLVAGAVGASALFLLAPRLALLGVALFLAVSTVVVYSTIRNRSHAVLALSGLQERSWLGARPAVYINATNFEQEARAGRSFEEWVPVWETEFWNRSFAGVLSLGRPEPSPFFQRNGTLDWATGRISGGGGITTAITDTRFVPDGSLVARQGRLALWDVTQPLRFVSVTEGVFADGKTTGTAAYSRWTGSGRVSVTVSAPARVVAGRFEPLPGGGGRVAGHASSQTVTGTTTLGRLTAPFRVEVRAPAGTRVTFGFAA